MGLLKLIIGLMVTCMDKICLIRQPAGLGDIFYLQKIAHEILTHGYKIVWPVQDNFLYITQYIRTPYINFYSEVEDFPFKNIYLSNPMEIIKTDNFRYIPFQHADRMTDTSNSMLLDIKYKLVNSDFNGWADYFNFKRNFGREDMLFYHILGLADSEDYILVNKNFGSPPNTKQITNINISSELKIVNMDFYGLDVIFDWCKVIENAKEIHTVDTSICYIMEKLNLKTPSVNLYCRFNKNDKNYNYLNNVVSKTKYSLTEGIFQ